MGSLVADPRFSFIGKSVFMYSNEKIFFTLIANTTINYQLFIRTMFKPEPFNINTKIFFILFS